MIMSTIMRPKFNMNYGDGEIYEESSGSVFGLDTEDCRTDEWKDLVAAAFQEGFELATDQLEEAITKAIERVGEMEYHLETGAWGILAALNGED